MDKAFALENMNKEARALPQTSWMWSDSGEKLLILKQLGVKIPTDFKPPLPPDLIVEHDWSQKNIKRNSEDHWNSRGLILPLLLSHPCLLVSFLTVILLISMLKWNSEDDRNIRDLRITVLLMDVSHLVCLRQCCTLIVRQIKSVGVSAGTPTNRILTIWPTAIWINNLIFPGLLVYRILDHRPTRMLSVAEAVAKLP